jgi:DNA polymerase I-like protein with 3'-5' exonuclease and polymerase domains
VGWNGGLRLAFDIEADELLGNATKIHCIVLGDLDHDEITAYGPTEISAALDHLSRADYLTGHNICGYDLALLRRLHGWAPSSGCTIVDTLIASRLIFPHIAELDDRVAAITKQTLGKLRGRYSLEAWGARLGVAKTGIDIEDWSAWSPEMQERCVVDVRICKALWHFSKPDGYNRQAVELEHRAAAICDRITADGVPFNTDAAKQLEQQWLARLAPLETKLAQQFPGTNLNSRRQLAALLEERGWIPAKRTEKTKQPKIDDELLETISAVYPEFAGLAKYLLLVRRLAALSVGKEAWLKHVYTDGRIHGGIVHIGTPHGRAKHLKPNLAQVPNPKKGKPYGCECRALFRPGNDWVCVAADQASLQDRGIAHYLSPHDGGAYAKAFVEGTDTHWRSATELGLVPEGTERDKENKVHAAIREGAKRFRYALLYGAQAATAGRIIYDTTHSVQLLDSTSDLHQQFFGRATHPGESALKQVGTKALKRFTDGTPGLSRLQVKLQRHAERHGWLPGLDGRLVPVSALYTSLNYIVTSSEAIICKRWLVRVYGELCARFRYGWDGDAVIVLWVHDELVICCRPEIAEQVGELMVRHAREAGEFYKFRVPLDADYKIGRSWAGEAVNGKAAEPATDIQGNIDKTDAGLIREGIEPVVAVSAAPLDNAVDNARMEDAPAEDSESAENGEFDEAESTTTALEAEPPGVCIHCRQDIPDGSERVDAHNGGWLHPDCVDAFIRARMAEEGIAWENPNRPERPVPPPPPPSPAPERDPPPPNPPPRGNGHAGNGYDPHRADYKHADPADEPYAPIRIRLISRGYRLARSFDFVLPGGTVLFTEDRYELADHIPPDKNRPRKTCRYRYSVNGVEYSGTGPRRIIYNWRAIMAAGPGATVFVVEGANKANPLIAAGLLATAAPYHQWGNECVEALAGRHILYLEDHDYPDAKGQCTAKKLSADAQAKLSPRAASFRIVPGLLLWKNLGHTGEPPHGWDVKDWIEQGGDATELIDICKQVPTDLRELESVSAASVDMESYDWLWPGRFAIGEIGLIVGMPDEGKGQMLAYIAARVTRELTWPNNEGQAPQGNVILLTAEDHIKKTIVPRLEAAGADRSRIEILKMVNDIDPKDGKRRKRMLSLVTDLDRLRQKVLAIGGVNTILIDPATAYLGVGKVDSYRTTDIRAVLSPLRDLAEELSVAVIGIMHFNKKVDVTNVLLRVSDSLAFVAAPRHVFGVIDDREHGRKLVVSAKNNLADAEQKRKSLAFHFDAKQVGTDPRNGKPIEAPFIVLEPGYVDVTASEALSAVNENKSPTMLEDAKRFLRDMLVAGGGRALRADIEEAAEAEKISERTLRRAKTALKIRAEKDRAADGKWYWILPEERCTESGDDLLSQEF